MTKTEELQVELRTLISIHERCQQPWSGDINDLKGYLTDRKRQVRNQLKRLKQGG